MPIVEVDDLVVAVQRMTAPDRQPMLHYWDTHPDAGNLPVSRIAELQIAVAEVLRPALDAVIGNHLETETPVVAEDDHLLREPDKGEQRTRRRSAPATATGWPPGQANTGSR